VDVSGPEDPIKAGKPSTFVKAVNLLTRVEEEPGFNFGMRHIICGFFSALGKFLGNNTYRDYDSFLPHPSHSSLTQSFDAIQSVTDSVVY
jgi:hypothetical protein